MKLRKGWIVTGVLGFCLLAGIVAALFIPKGEKAAVDESTFSAKTDLEAFQTIPIMAGEKITYDQAVDIGGNTFAINATETTYDEYKAYLNLLEKNGFKKYVDNGKDGIEGNVYAAYYQKDNLLVHVSYMKNIKRTMINVSKDENLSDHLFYNASFVADNKAGAQTKLHFQELYKVGNNFIFQLKNGNFILEDGGDPTQLPYLLDYLESLTPEGQKPLIEAWFISHSHLDHMGVFTALTGSTTNCKRIQVESIYYSAPSREAQKLPAGVYDAVDKTTFTTTNINNYLRNSKGEKTPIYRTHMGDRLYFNDITIDVIYSHELIDAREWDTWNSSSTMYMYTIEGQKVMFPGDADLACQDLIMDIYDAAYFDIDIYQVAHHGYNVLKETANYFKRIDTLLYPTHGYPNASAEGSFLGRRVQNEYLKAFAKEILCWDKGTLVLTFPYTVGSAQQLAPCTWEYNVEQPAWKTLLAE